MSNITICNRLGEYTFNPIMDRCIFLALQIWAADSVHNFLSDVLVERKLIIEE